MTVSSRAWLITFMEENRSNRSGEERNADLCSDLGLYRASLRQKGFSTTPVFGQISVDHLLLALDDFTECTRYLNTRRSKGAMIRLQSENDVQDALFLMLRLWVKDLTYEEPSEKVAGRFTIKDFVVPSARTIIEAKYIRNEDHGKQISKELYDDIENYRHHSYCDQVIFFIYDPDSLMPEKASLKQAICTPRTYDGKNLHCHLVVKP
jgi:hypothetical protein